MAHALPILFEDDELIALNKPAGLSSQSPPIAGDSLETLVRTYLTRGDASPAYLGLVHRLDRPVSGVVLWAKTTRAARILARQFERRQVQKTYWALVEGSPTFADALWEDWLVREQTGLGRVQVCRPGTPRAQLARTRAQSNRADELPPDTAWLVLRPETGRMHQLRVQCAHRGMPVVGDMVYGATRPWAEHAIALHARSITVKRPGTGEALTLVAPLPVRWGRLVVDC
jgi:23S rRNA pseudouridine1911/1915/1917 synthase